MKYNIKSTHTELVADLLPIVARLNCPKMDEIEGCAIYAVQQPWQKDLLVESGARQIALPSDFEIAVQDESVDSIYVPKFVLTHELMRRVLTRNGQTKTIFWEV